MNINLDELKQSAQRMRDAIGPNAVNFTAAQVLGLISRVEQLQARDIGVDSLEKLRHAMVRFGISPGEGGLEAFGARFEGHLLAYISDTLRFLDRARVGAADAPSEGDLAILRNECGECRDNLRTQPTKPAPAVSVGELPPLPDHPFSGLWTHAEIKVIRAYGQECARKAGAGQAVGEGDSK